MSYKGNQTHNRLVCRLTLGHCTTIAKIYSIFKLEHHSSETAALASATKHKWTKKNIVYKHYFFSVLCTVFFKNTNNSPTLVIRVHLLTRRTMTEGRPWLEQALYHETLYRAHWTEWLIIMKQRGTVCKQIYLGIQWHGRDSRFDIWLRYFYRQFKIILLHACSYAGWREAFRGIARIGKCNVEFHYSIVELNFALAYSP